MVRASLRAAAAGAQADGGRPLSALPCDVTIHSLAARPDLNGKRGRAISLDVASGRYHVVLHDGGDTLALRAKNVRQAELPARAQKLIVEVSLVAEQKRVSVLSTTCLVNATNQALDVRLWQPLEVAAKG